MPGTKASGRPGGNPELKNYGFTTDRPEPLREKLQLRVSASMKEKIKSRENWQEFVRDAIAKALEEPQSA
ncbi:MAG: hypothetical protein QNJ34_26530 [Xenococcaceae cyanobacterium MO_188.B29]|nr:hypothetical protein [Xenococcaceae cyanobacterium MO_188.B29]